MYDLGKILQVGGNGYYNDWKSPSSAAATVIDITGIGQGRVTVADTQPMANPRQWGNATVLPNGQVLVTGGSRYADQGGDNAVLPAETWNPATGRWTVGASSALYRGYHSTALLLPDGAVLTAGGGIPGPLTNRNAQIYYPAYLFRQQGAGSVLATRPRIVSIETLTPGYAKTLGVQIADGSDVAEVSLIASGSVTHSFDSNQRRLKLAFQRTASGVSVTLPASANLAPPGYYQLALVNAAGVPSPAVIVALGAAAPTGGGNATPAPTPAASAGAQIGLDARTIDAASDGTLTTANVRNELWVSQMGAQWTQVPGQFVDAAPIAANRYYGVGTDKLVYRWNGSGWKVVGRDSKAIAAASDGTVAVINSNNNSVWVKNADDEVERWTQVPGAFAKQLALVKRGSLYFVGTDNNAWRSDLVGNPVRVGVNVRAISASADGSVTVVSGDGSVWRKAGDDTVESWTAMGVNADAVATPDARRLVYTDAAGRIYAR
jgi:hypothetical protein